MGRKVRTPCLTEEDTTLSQEERVRRLRRASLILVGIARRVDALQAGGGLAGKIADALMEPGTIMREDWTGDTPEARAA